MVASLVGRRHLRRMPDNPAPAPPGDVQPGAAAPQHILNLNLDHLQEVALVGVRRAASFLAVGLNSTKGKELPSLALSAQSMWRFLPDPAPEALAQEVVREFRSWVIGNGLRELDAHFNRFLDAVWAAIQLGKLHGQRVAWTFTPDDISADTNAAKKFSKIMREVGGDDSQAGRLWSLTNARNCLTHSAGIVGRRHTNEGQMKILWIGLESRLRQGDNEVVIGPVIGPEGLTAPDPSMEAEIGVFVVEREKVFPIGQPVALEPHELHEICFYYSHLTGLVIAALIAFFTAAGVMHQPPSVATP
ncbi:MAG TPA: hypothetical protein VGS12_11065 [Caulobacteraceae bacterium]|nr:hypothetical protein [Caulobacteraceae bacterium]